MSFWGLKNGWADTIPSLLPSAAIKCENSKINDILYEGKNIATDKENKDLHGIGLKSIRDSFEKYDGVINIEISDEKFTLSGFLIENWYKKAWANLFAYAFIFYNKKKSQGKLFF